MRKITLKAAYALITGKPFKQGNTQVLHVFDEFHGSCSEFLLCGNPIAIYYRKSNKLFVTTSGYSSVTTKERLNGILRLFGLPELYQKNFIWYFRDGIKFDNPRSFKLKD